VAATGESCRHVKAPPGANNAYFRRRRTSRIQPPMQPVIFFPISDDDGRLIQRGNCDAGTSGDGHGKERWNSSQVRRDICFSKRCAEKKKPPSCGSHSLRREMRRVCDPENRVSDQQRDPANAPPQSRQAGNKGEAHQIKLARVLATRAPVIAKTSTEAYSSRCEQAHFVLNGAIASPASSSARCFPDLPRVALDPLPVTLMPRISRCPGAAKVLRFLQAFRGIFSKPFFFPNQNPAGDAVY